MSSIGFSTTIDLNRASVGRLLPRSGARPAELVIDARGRWLHRQAGASAAVDLEHAWVAPGGSLIGIQLRTDTGRRHRLYLHCWGVAPDDWRRLRVRIRWR